MLTLLAVGGMGRVYLALGPDREAVALKVARPELAADPRFRARFRREVATARGVGGGRAVDASGEAGAGDTSGEPGAGGGGAADSGGGAGADSAAGAGGAAAGSAGGGRVGGAALIAPVVAADPDAELPWLASEYVPGPSITDALLAFGPFSPAGLHTLTHGLALALAEVHAAGVVHRDVKPSNVLVAPDGPRLIDFGVARAVDDVPLTRAGALIGSPGFLSPEQAVGEPTTFASDVFAMATVVAYAARGQSPFGAGDGPALLYRVVHEPPKLDGLPDDLAELLTACLAKDPTERPSAPEIADRVAPAADWLSQAVLDDIARREAELAAWLEVTAADPLWVRPASAAQTTAFDSVADSALDIANAVAAQPSRIGARRRKPRYAESKPQTNPQTQVHTEAQSALSQAASYELRRPTPPLGSPADGIREPGLPRGSAEQPAASGTPLDLPHYSPKQPDTADSEQHRPEPGVKAAHQLGPQHGPEAPAEHTEPPRLATAKPGSAYAAHLAESAADNTEQTRPDHATAAKPGSANTAHLAEPATDNTESPQPGRATAARPGSAYAAHLAEPAADNTEQTRPGRATAARPGSANTAHLSEPATDNTESPQPGRATAARPGSAYASVLLDPESEPSGTDLPATEPTASQPPTTHHRAPRRRFPVYAALGAFLGGAVAATLLLLPHTRHSAPPRPLSPATSVSSTSTTSTSSTTSAGKPKAASPTPSGGRSGRVSSPRTTSASGSRR